MNKQVRQLELLLELMNERDQIEENIKALPVGYISVKQISGHTYYYRQWREGKQIISSYVPEAFLNATKRKIAARKEQESLLRAVKAELKKAMRKVSKERVLEREEVERHLTKSKTSNLSMTLNGRNYYQWIRLNSLEVEP